LLCEGANLSRKLTLDFRQQVFLMFKEALTNVAKHARATKVEVRLQDRLELWNMRVRDNGVGFDPAATHGGNGLKSLRARAAKAGGKLEVRSQPGQGTEVVFTANLF
jgi:signal transduction histidine kinase